MKTKLINDIIFQMFKGKFHHCENYPDVATKKECLERPDGKWTNRSYNFDNLAKVTFLKIVQRSVEYFDHATRCLCLHEVFCFPGVGYVICARNKRWMGDRDALWG